MGVRPVPKGGTPGRPAAPQAWLRSQGPRASSTTSIVLAALASALALLGFAGPAAGTVADDRADGPQWNLTRVHAQQAWAAGQGQGAVVAVVDSGVEAGHEDLASRVIGQTGCIGAAGDPGRCGGTALDDDGHGTHVAGIVAASADHGFGVTGVAPRASLLAVRVLQRHCEAECTVGGSGSDVAAGIRWASRQGADVINLSLGSAVSRTLGADFDLAVEEAWSGGSVIVVAAGDDLAAAPLAPDSPAIVVTATTRDDGHPPYAHPAGEAGPPARFGMAAPGGEPGDSPATCTTRPLGVLSTYVRDGRATYGCLAGTSMAAPHVAGAAALLRGLGVGAADTRSLLLATADDLGPPGPDPLFGAGRLNVARAVEEGLALLAARSAPFVRPDGAVSPLATIPVVPAPAPLAVPPTASPPPDPDPAAPAAQERREASRLLAGAGAAVLVAGTGAGAWRVRRRQGG